MTSLRRYLDHKRTSRAAIEAAVRAGNSTPATVSATVTVGDRTGLRRIGIRDHHLLSDSAASYAGYDLGPTSPELQVGVLGSCIAHTFLIHASVQQIPLDNVTVDVSADLDPRAGIDGFEDIAPQPANIRYTVRLESDAPDDQLTALHELVERACPLINLIRTPNDIRGELVT